VVKCFPVELINIGFPAFVVRVTVPALLFQGIGLPPVESLLGLTIRRGFLVAIEAKASLRLPREWLVALATVFLELGVSLNNRAGYYEFFKEVLRRDSTARGDDEHAREQQYAFNAAAQYHAPLQY
jgi:hypothetical protein